MNTKDQKIKYIKWTLYWKRMAVFPCLFSKDQHNPQCIMILELQKGLLRNLCQHKKFGIFLFLKQIQNWVLTRSISTPVRSLLHSKAVSGKCFLYLSTEPVTDVDDITMGYLQIDDLVIDFTPPCLFSANKYKKQFNSPHQSEQGSL